jgi:3-hydroxybutyryl-CoA dehydrogenase
MSILTVGVVGAGVIGRGVAQNLAQAGYQVILLDISRDILERAKQDILRNLRLYGLFKKGGEVQVPQAVLDRIQFSVEESLLSRADAVIENVTEKWEIKKDVYIRLDKICPPHSILAANTSAIPITRLAALTKRPAKVIGMHFMNPVPLKPTVEVIRGYHTSDETIETAKTLLASMGKDCILVNDSPGFVSNRVMMQAINEAIFLLHDQVASAEDIDKIFKSCFGHKMGPLETADLIGLDTVLFSIEVLYEHFNDSKYRPCPLLKKMVDAGLLGQKSGQGFFTYYTGE